MALDLMERDLSDSYSELTPLTAEELEMDGGMSWSSYSGDVSGIYGAASLGLGAWDMFCETAPELAAPMSIAFGAASTVLFFASFL
ncbi:MULTISPECIES: hypothetical protein [Ferrimicrobium]|uniref:hypothetical protein n=1 Tax=Ferrimicrobium TaxID=121038 RepID=UPI0023F2426D|nr:MULTISPECIES: hypothetical protein [Ferrimicrobium]